MRKVLAGCHRLRRLAEKAASVGHLDHGERLSLLYSLGHLGKEGRRCIHAIIGKCANYDVAETERHIAGLRGLPIGCRRLKDKHPELGGETDCECTFDRQRIPRRLRHAPAPRSSLQESVEEMSSETEPQGPPRRGRSTRTPQRLGKRPAHRQPRDPPLPLPSPRWSSTSRRGSP